MYKKILTIAIVVITVVSALTLLPNKAYAAESTSFNPFSGLIQMITQKFGLDKTQVTSVVNEYKNTERSNRQQNMIKNENARLNQLVKDGKITQAQMDSIVSELKVLREKYGIGSAQDDLTPTERREKMKKYQDELQAWAKSQNIDTKYLFLGRGGMMKNNGGGMMNGEKRGGMMGRNWDDDDK